MNKFLRIFLPKPPEKPMDLSNFEEARENLHRNVKATAKELDAFGALVRDMRGLKPINKKRRSRTR